ncbi:DUF2264 domain-containing protein [Clostridium folliculivorans]|uniref:DUF2264 domain-containing protein n=1 Tax=Clostridium folliculivorans TaxID=2886038 RepID=UPI0021C38999|nr:DUF2264 domain-containing protein [Clostridium folliculivorans]GKU28838.1 hypothetical protein CFB3_09440 [Clostridium folliculivorans]
MSTIENRSDLVKLTEEFLKPIMSKFSEGNAYLNFGVTEAHYGKKVAGFEAFSRPLWAVFFSLASGEELKELGYFIEGIKNGTNPNHKEYWGEVKDYSQKLVEMAVYGVGLIMAGDKLLAYFNEKEKANFLNWLSVEIQREVPDNNWHFFRILVSIGLKKVGWNFNKKVLEDSLERVEEFYIGDGWYSDGLTNQRDYYISFAMHFYGLIYAKAMKNEDSDRSKIFKRRAYIFAKDFIYWFDKEGKALPFGRSLTYRFAQCAFWSAMVYADLRPYSLGVMKGIILRHLRWWIKQPILSDDGLLTIGYGYGNISMAEEYNAPGSPYWAFKSFLILALKEDSEFWQAKEEPLPRIEEIHVIKPAFMILNHDEGSKHVFCITSGQYADFEPNHTQEKYTKFAYSNHFGFNISKDNYGIEKFAFDSCLAFSERDNYYRTRRRCDKIKIEGNTIFSEWHPWENVRVQTWLVALGQWHIRVHKINTKRKLDIIEGGFPVIASELRDICIEKEYFICKGENGVSAIVDLLNNREVLCKYTPPNSNVMYPSRMRIPGLYASVDEGERLFATAVLAHPDENTFDELWKFKPSMTILNSNIEITYKDEIIKLLLT